MAWLIGCLIDFWPTKGARLFKPFAACKVHQEQPPDAHSLLLAYGSRELVSSDYPEHDDCMAAAGVCIQPREGKDPAARTC